jgi:hypothetical protein
MNISWKKTTLAAVAALSLGLSLATPASAQWRGGWGPAVGLGVLGGVALGAAAANAGPHYGPGPDYDGDCWLERRPIFDEYGNRVGARRVRVCR